MGSGLRKRPVTVKTTKNPLPDDSPRIIKIALAPNRSWRGFLLTRCNAPYLISIVLSKPEIAIWSDNDACRPYERCWKKKFGDLSAGAHAPYLVTIKLGKPEIAIRSSRDTRWSGTRMPR